MIGIKVNGEFLELFENTRINLKRRNPIFGDSDNIPGTYSIPFTVPFGKASETNTRILGNPDIVENADSPLNKELDAKIYYDNQVLETGKIKLKPSSRNQISITFLGGLRSVSKDFKDTKLKDLDWDDITLHSVNYGEADDAVVSNESAAQSIMSTSITNLNTALTAGTFKFHAIRNPEFSSEADYVGMVNYLDSSQHPLPNRKVVRKAYRWTTSLTYSTGFDVSPYYNGTLSIEFDGTTFSSLSGNDWVFQKIKKIVSNIAANSTLNGFKLYAEFVRDQDLATTDRNGDLLVLYAVLPLNVAEANEFDDFTLGSGWQEITSYQNSFYSNRFWYVPTFSIKSILEQIESKFSITFKGDFINDTDLQKLYIYCNNSINIPITVTTGIGLSGEVIYGFKNKLSPGEYLPDWKVSEFLKELCSLFNMMPEYNPNSQVITLIYRENIVEEDSYVDSKSEGIDFVQEIVDDISKTGFTLKYERALVPKATYYQQSYQRVIATGTEDIISKFSISDIDYGLGFLYVYSDLQLKMFYNEKEGLQNPLLFFDNGINDNQHSALSYRLDGFDVVYELYFKNNPDTKNLYVLFHQNWLTMQLRAKEVLFTSHLQYRHLSLLDFTKKIMYDRVKYFYKEIDLTLTMQGIKPSKVTLIST